MRSSVLNGAPPEEQQKRWRGRSSVSNFSHHFVMHAQRTGVGAAQNCSW
jgi:hypothetical protein